MSKPLLTAVIPVSRMAGRLSHLKPLLNQCVDLGIEIVIVHDEQDSKTGGELEEITRSVNSEKINLVTKSLYSPGKARNLGIEIATGDWICFWDSDDTPMPENFLEMVRQADHLGHGVAVGKFRQKSGEITVIYGITVNEIGRMPGIWRFAFKREPNQICTFPEYKMGEDQVFLGRILVHLRDYFRYEKVVYEYCCDNPGQLTKNQKAILEIQFALQDMLKIIANPIFNNKVLLIFLSKQILTLSKHGSLKLKFKLIGIVAKGFRVGGKDFFVIFLKEVFVSLVKQFKPGGNH